MVKELALVVAEVWVVALVVLLAIAVVVYPVTGARNWWASRAARPQPRVQSLPQHQGELSTV